LALAPFLLFGEFFWLTAVSQKFISPGKPLPVVAGFRVPRKALFDFAPLDCFVMEQPRQGGEQQTPDIEGSTIDGKVFPTNGQPRQPPNGQQPRPRPWRRPIIRRKRDIPDTGKGIALGNRASAVSTIIARHIHIQPGSTTPTRHRRFTESISILQQKRE